MPAADGSGLTRQANFSVTSVQLVIPIASGPIRPSHKQEAK